MDATVIELYLARHGQTAVNAQRRCQGSSINGPLNDLGMRQAQALADALKDVPLDAVVTSGLQRAIQTGEIVQQHHPQLKITTDSRINEISWGIMDGKTFKEAGPETNRVVRRWTSGDFDAHIRGGESAADCQTRVRSAMQEILLDAQASNYRRLFFAMHGRILRVLMAALVDGDLRQMQKYSHTNCCYHMVKVALNEGEVDLEKCRFEMVRMDVRDHLEGVESSHTEREK